MEFAELNVEKRTRTGKNEARKLRVAGKVPAVIYGDNKGAVPLAVDGKAIRAILQKDGHNVVFKLKGLTEVQTAMIKDIQRHPIKDSFVHIDFKIIALDEAIEASVPLELVGDAAGVKDGGVLQQALREISIKALPHKIPERIELDVSGLNIGEALKISDLPSLDGVEVLNSKEEQVVSVVPPTELKEEAAPAEEEAEEGQEAALEETAEEPPSEEESQGE